MTSAWTAGRAFLYRAGQHPHSTHDRQTTACSPSCVKGAAEDRAKDLLLAELFRIHCRPCLVGVMHQRRELGILVVPSWRATHRRSCLALPLPFSRHGRCVVSVRQAACRQEIRPRDAPARSGTPSARLSHNPPHHPPRRAPASHLPRTCMLC